MTWKEKQKKVKIDDPDLFLEGYENYNTLKTAREVLENYKQDAEGEDFTPWHQALYDNFHKTVPIYGHAGDEGSLFRGYVGVDKMGNRCKFSEAVTIFPVPRGFSYMTVSSEKEAMAIVRRSKTTVTAHGYSGKLIRDPLFYGRHGEPVLYRVNGNISICVLRNAGLSREQLVNIHHIFAHKAMGAHSQHEIDTMDAESDFEYDNDADESFDKIDEYSEPEDEEEEEKMEKKTKRVKFDFP